MITPLLDNSRSPSENVACPNKQKRLRRRRTQRQSIVWTGNVDDPTHMTYGRRIASYLMKYQWYNPQAGCIKEFRRNASLKMTGESKMELDAEAIPPPSLARAWAYFEHVTLPRYIVNESDDQKHGWFKRHFCNASIKFDRADPGEKYKPTELYSPTTTPLRQMGDFGLGVGLYFSALRYMAFLTLIAGLINIPNIIYFASEEYSGPKTGDLTSHFLLKASAICIRQEWVPCPNCTTDDFARDGERIGFANSTVDEVSEVLTFALKNNCDGARLTQGMVNWATLAFIMAGMYVLTRMQKEMEVKFDEDEQTAQDYTIIVNNPPPDSTDPNEWRDFFSRFDNTHVTCVTVALENDLLIQSLVERRERLRQISMSLPPETSMDELNLARIAAKIETNRSLIGRLIATFFHPFGLFLDIPALYGRLIVVTAKIRGLAQQDYPATNVFVTFESEAAQRSVLSRLTVGKLAICRNDTSVLPTSYLFRKKLVLDVSEPDEPSTIRWQDLNSGFKDRLKPLCITTVVTFAMIFIVAVLVYYCRDESAVVRAFIISAFNAVFPMMGKAMTNLEPHPSESSRQASLFFKVAFFRWFNTAVTIQIITPFTYTLNQGGGYLISSIYAIFFADIITSNVLQFTDIFGHIQRHFLAPRAFDQERMNMLFQGTHYELAERFSNMSKIIFLAFYYCAIYPGAMFMCSFALFVNYYTDKFSILRTWAPAPLLGSVISRFNGRFVMPLAVLMMAIASSYFWTGFPYDNLCDDNEPAEEEYIGTHEVLPKEGDAKNVTIGNGAHYYRFCNQDLINLKTGVSFFPALPKFQPQGDEWMTDEQVVLTNIYGWSSVIVLGLVTSRILFHFFHETWKHYQGIYKPSGKDMGINFSKCTSTNAYIPQIKSLEFSYPLIAVSTENINEELIDWTDPDRPHSYYNLTKDAEEILMGNDVTRDATKNVFDRINHWPPADDTAVLAPIISKAIDPQLKELLMQLDEDIGEKDGSVNGIADRPRNFDQGATEGLDESIWGL